MLMPSSNGHQTNLFGTDLLLQLDPNDPLLVLARVIPWPELERDLGCHYCPGVGRPALPIKLMAGLLLLK
jgi:transposase, IS5 family